MKQTNSSQENKEIISNQEPKNPTTLVKQPINATIVPCIIKVFTNTMTKPPYPWGGFPDEISCQIFSFLDPKNLSHLFQVCQWFYKYQSISLFWKLQGEKFGYENINSKEDFRNHPFKKAAELTERYKTCRNTQEDQEKKYVETYGTQPQGYYRNTEPAIRNMQEALRLYSERCCLDTNINPESAHGQGSSEQPDTIRKTFQAALNKDFPGGLQESYEAMQTRVKIDPLYAYQENYLSLFEDTFKLIQTLKLDNDLPSRVIAS